MEISIETTNLKKEYPGHMALDSINFSVKKGSIHGFLGPNGAGKTTTMKILTGLINQSSGEFKVNGKIGFLPETPPLYGNMTVDDYLTFVLNIFSAEKNNEEKLTEIKKQCGLTEVSSRLIVNLSKGYRQRVGIAQALIHSPEIIILDEPTVGLDPVAIVDIRNLIASLKGKHTILFSSHQLHEVELLCEEITLINKGKVLVSGSIDKIQSTLRTKKQFAATVLQFNNEIKNTLMKNFPIESIEFEKKDEKHFNLKIYCGPSFNDEQIFELTGKLSSKEIGLYRFEEEKMDLEEIFNKITKS